MHIHRWQGLSIGSERPSVAAERIGRLVQELVNDLAWRKSASPELSAVLAALNSLDLAEGFAAPQSDPIVPGLRHIPAVIEQVSSESSGSLPEAALATAGYAAWSTFYARSEWSDAFVDDIAVGVLISPNGPLVSSSVIVGLFLQGSYTSYPAHAHPAAEVYRVLSGVPEFQVGSGGEHREQRPGSVVVHHSDELHAIRTGRSPLFAVYVWIGDLGGRTWYPDDIADPESARSYADRIAH
jgi:mannose-6-phosphate isomerase-like protein (cupin superfamily)